MKTVYLVRHGESESNARTNTTYRGLESQLTEKGRAQALAIAERAARIPFDVLISSPWVRARDTAEAISQKTGKPVEYSELFTETRAPLSFIGTELVDVAFRARLRAWNDSLFSDVEKVEEGENFTDLKARAKSALAFLDARNESSILIATHGLFLRAFVLYVLFGEDLTPKLFKQFTGASKTDNTGITILTNDAMPQSEVDESVRWRLRVFNDHAHLG